MRFSIIAVAAFVGLATAQAGGFNLPACAQKCATEATSGGKIGGCDLVNVGCICSNSAFLDSIACCLTANCDVSDQQLAAAGAASLCKAAAGVTNLPTAVVCSTASAASTSSGSAPTASSGAATTSSAGSQITSAISSAASRSATPSATPNVAPQNVAGLGAGVLGAMALVLL